MMHNNKFIACVKFNGKILREHGETVYVPFGATYSILLKNLNSVRSLVTIEIDGTSATEDTELVINGNSELELTRYIKNGNLNEGNSFKFIERNAAVEQHRGVGIEDGLIRISFKFEKVYAPYVPSPYIYDRRNPWNQYPRVWYGSGGHLSGSVGINGELPQSSIRGIVPPSTDAEVASVNTVFTASAELARVETSVNQAGITVPGAVTEQQFQVVSSFPTDGQEHVIVLKLLGETSAGKIVTAPVTVQHKPRCITCGKQNKAYAKFCHACGTALEII